MISHTESNQGSEGGEMEKPLWNPFVCPKVDESVWEAQSRIQPCSSTLLQKPLSQLPLWAVIVYHGRARRAAGFSEEQLNPIEMDNAPEPGHQIQKEKW